MRHLYDQQLRWQRHRQSHSHHQPCTVLHHCETRCTAGTGRALQPGMDLLSSLLLFCTGTVNSESLGLHKAAGKGRLF